MLARPHFIFLSLTLALFSLARAATPAGDPVKIGFFMSVTGRDASFGEAALRGARLAIDDLNAAGGILGRPTELVVEDNRSLPGESATAAKKLIAKDARISVPVKKTECYLIRETPVSAEDELVEQFNGTRSARRRILLAEELVDGSDKATSQKDLAAVLAGLATSVLESNQLDAAERLYGTAIRDDLAKLVGSETVYEPTQASLIANQRDLPEIAEKIPVHFQSRFLELILATHPIETRDIVFGLLKVSQGKFTTECINFLVEQGYSDDLAATLT
eukprot:gene52104-63696_t